LHKDLNEQRTLAEEQEGSIRRLRESRDQLRGKNQGDMLKRKNLRIWMSRTCALTDEDIDAIEAGFGEAVDTARAFARAMLPHQTPTSPLVERRLVFVDGTLLGSSTPEKPQGSEKKMAPRETTGETRESGEEDLGGSPSTVPAEGSAPSASPMSQSPWDPTRV
jgi:hypothetical protein